MKWERSRRIGAWAGLVAAILVLVVIHQEAHSAFVASIRVGMLLSVFLTWRYLVDLLVAGGLVHPIKRTSAVAFRSRYLALVGVIEIVVIQQVPAMIVDALTLER